MNKAQRNSFLVVAVLLAAMIALLLCSSGCATSKSYQYGVADLYPIAAIRVEPYVEVEQDLAPKVAALRAAAIPPVTYESASTAWRDIAGDYRRHIGADEALSPFRRSDWLSTADKLDELNAAEAKRRLLFFLPP